MARLVEAYARHLQKGQVGLEFWDELMEGAQRYVCIVGSQRLNFLLHIWCIKGSAVCMDI